MTKRWGALAVPALAVAVFLWVAWARRFTIDDAFINYRVVRQIQGGHGPVFNIGERVEVATSPLWLGLLVLADDLSPLRIEWTALLLEIALGAAGLIAAMAGAVRLADLGRAEPRADRVVVPVGALAYLGPAVAWDFATGGLENGLALAWIGGSFWAVVCLLCPARASPVERRGGRMRLRYRLGGTAALVGLGVLVRPDLAVLSLGLAVPVGVAAWRAGRGRAVVAVAGAALALPLAVQIGRMGYYGQLFPNTFYAKEGTLSSWRQGGRYLADFAGTYVLVVPVAVVAAWLVAARRADRSPGRRDRWLVVAAVEAAAAAYTLVVVRVGGDYMHGRLLLAAWFTLLLPIAAVPRADLRARRHLLPAAALLAWTAVAAVALRPQLGSLFAPRVAGIMAMAGVNGPATGVLDVRTAGVMWSGRDHPVTSEQLTHGLHVVGLVPGRDLFEPHDYPPGSPTEYPVAPDIGESVSTVSSLGAWSYRAPLDVWVLDRLGLADPVTARVALAWRGTPGHEKTLPTPWIAARFVAPDHPVIDPSRFVVLDVSTKLLVGIDVAATPLDPAGFARQRAAARAALGCGALRERIYDVRAQMTPRRFLGNMVDAVRLERFRFPADPEAARRRLCG